MQAAACGIWSLNVFVTKISLPSIHINYFIAESDISRYVLMLDTSNSATINIDRWDRESIIPEMKFGLVRSCPCLPLTDPDPARAPKTYP